jgi:hypothetical protein
MPITIDGTGNITGLVAGGLPDLSITNADLAADAVSTGKILNNAVTTAKLGTSEASGLAKAWVNFNGTGTVAIRASFNVSSITDNGTGDYTVNFTTALADANYAYTLSRRQDSGQGGSGFLVLGSESFAPTTSAFRFLCQTVASLFDSNTLCVAIFR